MYHLDKNEIIAELPKKKRVYKVIGWREWVSLPELGIKTVKAKVDTGAKTSTLHAIDVEIHKRGTKKYVSFAIHPYQKDNHYTVRAEAELYEERHIKDSGGKVTIRPVIRTEIKIGKVVKQIELTLINRDEMGFRMLIGREAIKGQYLVNPMRSFLSRKKKRKKRE